MRLCLLTAAVAVLLALPGTALADVSVAEGCITQQGDSLVTFSAQITDVSPQWVYVFAQRQVPDAADMSTTYRLGYGYVDWSGSIRVDSRFQGVPTDLTAVYLTVRPSNWGTGIITQALVPICGADTTPPDLSLPSAPVLVEATDAHGAVGTYTATASDATSGTSSAECSPASGSAFPLGDTEVSCRATDAAGNSATGTFTVRVVDTTAPKLSLPSDIAATATSAQGAKVAYAAATSADTVDGAVPVTCTPASGAQFAPGTTTVTCTATDRAGNTATGSFDVTVTYPWGGFDEPLRNNALTGNAGRTVPLKFTLDGAISIPKAVVLLGRQGKALSQVAVAGVSKGDFHLNLSTKGLAPGVYTVRVDLGDGVNRDATLTLT